MLIGAYVAPPVNEVLLQLEIRLYLFRYERAGGVASFEYQAQDCGGPDTVSNWRRIFCGTWRNNGGLREHDGSLGTRERVPVMQRTVWRTGVLEECVTLITTHVLVFDLVSRTTRA